MTTKLLIDGDILVYRMGYAVQDENDVPEPEHHARYLIKKLITSLLKKFKTTKFKLYLTSDDHSNFRFKIAKTLPYKGNRDKKINPNAPDKPVLYNEIRAYMVEKWFAEVIHDIEADDAMSIEQMKHLNDPEIKTIIVTIDKDLDMVPGWHYNFLEDRLYESKDPGELTLKRTTYLDKDGKEKKKTKLLGTGIKWFYAQMLLGDKADNIPGIKGCGPVAAHKVLEGVDSESQMFRTIQGAYFKAFRRELKRSEIVARLYEVGDLLWMQRYEGEIKSLELADMRRK